MLSRIRHPSIPPRCDSGDPSRILFFLTASKILHISRSTRLYQNVRAWGSSISGQTHAESSPGSTGVNDIGSHITCSTCALKSHILQTWLTGHTTCETCASEVTNWYAVRFLIKKLLHAMHPRSFGPSFFWPRFWKYFQKPVFLVPSENTDTV
jgi:hypothetical protein